MERLAGVALLLLAIGCSTAADDPPSDVASVDVTAADVPVAAADVVDVGPADVGAEDVAVAPPPVVYPSASELPEVLLGDTERPSEYVLPAQYDPAQAWPLIVLLHGYNANFGDNGHAGVIQDFYLQLSARASIDGFVQLIPQGTVDANNAQFWNATDHCCDFYGSGVDDVAYLSGLVDEASKLLHVDPQRIYLVGHSNGAYMAYRMACEAPERFAGIMALAGAATPCPGTEPVSVLHVHGENDDSVAFGGEPAKGNIGAKASAQHWADRNGCAPEPVMLEDLDLDTALDGAETTVASYTGCPEGVGVALWTIREGSHLPGFGAAFSEEVVAWLLARTAAAPR